MSDTSPLSSTPDKNLPPYGGSSTVPKKNRMALAIYAGIAAVVIFIIVGLFLAARPPEQQVQGMVEAEIYTVATKVPSRVESIKALEGQSVTAGQELALLSSPEVENGHIQASSLLRSSEALQSISREGDRVQDVRSLHSVWQAAQASAELAKKSARRVEALFADGVVSAQRRDEAVAARNASAAQAEAAHQQYLKAVAGTRQQDKEIADANVASARAAVAESESLIRETRLISPHAGEISERFANEGELVMPGVPVFTVVDINNPWVSFSVREDQYRDIRVGTRIRGDVPALNLKNVEFEITLINPQGAFATWKSTRQSRGYDVHSFRVRAKPVQPIRNMRPGMSVLFDWSKQ